MRPLDALLAPAPDPARVAWLKGRVFAHRGLHGGDVPENSLSAVWAAIARGLGIECDVQQSGDGRAVVFHDWSLERLTATSGPVDGRSSAQLSQIRIGDCNDRIPPLRILLEVVGGQVPLLIELKTRSDYRVDTLCEAVRHELEGYPGEVAVMGFDPRVGAWFHRYAPSVIRGLVVSEAGSRTLSGTIRRHAGVWHARPDFLAYDVRDLPSRFAAAQRRRGLPVLTWTVRDAALRRRAAQHADSPIAEAEGIAESGPSA
ncbi:glycerophosphodiester phosphodiesterase family protein [Croceibacterium soli]|uniref:glycerophosphodiester phosphodiesterase family protein n=1 Tax=Croceibacterium soli TaxID=1739690 RepID=UPI002E258F10|nr:glycerophosphodiester phosphodiesterase family protein [Croceibacterium soli]